MDTITYDVCSGGKVVTEATCPVYDSVQEAHEDKGEKFLLDMINSCVKTDAGNKARAGITGRPSKGSIAKDISHELQEEFIAALEAGDPTQSRIGKIRAESAGIEDPDERSAKIKGGVAMLLEGLVEKAFADAKASE